MTVTVVGSIAYDAVTTPSGTRDRMLGGAATHFALAASLFTPVRVVGPVGADFTDTDMETLATRGTSTDDVTVVEDGETFFWRGEYGKDLNTRETLDTQLNVFAEFEPKLSTAAADCDVLFLANIQPSLQASVLDQCTGPRWTALDSMNLWIDIARDDLVSVIERVDCLVLNDAELRQLTGKPTIIGAARKVLGMGPSAVIAKQGEYGATFVSHEGAFAMPAFPLEAVTDPTGAGDTFAGGLTGYIAAQVDQEIDHELIATAIAFGTACASFNVEDFGTERVAHVTAEEVHDRVLQLHEITQFHCPSPKGALA